MSGPRDFVQHLVDAFGLPKDQAFTFQFLTDTGASEGRRISRGAQLFTASAKTIGTEVIERSEGVDFPNVYITSGLYDPATITKHEGRLRENCRRVLWLTIDADAALWLARESGKKKDLQAGLQELDDSELKETLHQHYRECNTIANEVLKPSLWVRSGYGHYALYYLADGTDVELAVTASVALRQAWIRHAGYNCCDATTDAGTRIIRLPGTWNVKNPERPRKCITADGGGDLYTVAEILAACPDEPRTPGVVSPAQRDWEKRVCSKTREFIASGVTEERNNSLFRAACDMAGCGATEEEALLLLMDAAKKCGHDSSFTPHEAYRTVQSAFSRDREPVRKVIEDLEVADSLKDVGIEYRVLGLILRDAGCLATACERINEDDFSSKDSARVFTAARERNIASVPVDPVAISEELAAHKWPEAAELAALVATVPGDIHDLPSWLQQMIDLSSERSVVRLCADTVSILSGPHGNNEVANFVTKAGKVMDRVSQRDWKILRDSVGEEFDRIFARSVANKKAAEEGYTIPPLEGVPTGIAQIDEATGGLEYGTCSVIGGRTSDGKTSLAMAIALEAAEANIPVGYFPTEVGSLQMARKYLAMNIPVETAKLKRAILTEEQWGRISVLQHAIENFPFYTYECEGSLSQIQSAISNGVIKYGLKLVVIDFIQQVSAPFHVNNNAAKFSEIFRRLAAQTRGLGIHELWVSQLRRPDRDYGKSWRPQINDFMESGSIEQLVRYAFAVWQDNSDDRSSTRKAEIRCMKSTFGGKFGLYGEFDCTRQRFINLSETNNAKENAGDGDPYHG